MTKIIIERRSVLLFGGIIAAIAIIGFSIAVLILVEFSIWNLSLIIILLLLLSISLPYARSKKEIMVIDDMGLTLNDHITLGPIPWDCISDAKTYRILFDKTLRIYVKNIPKLEGLFGETKIHQRVGVEKKNGRKCIIIDLDLCKLRGIDIVGIINDYAENHKK